jgi:rod shape determining protein RodA
MKELHKKGGFDFTLFLLALSLWTIGIFLVYSATYIHESGPLAQLHKQQIVWVVMAIFVILAIVSIPGRIFYNLAYIFYGLSLVLLLLALAMGVSVKGAERWVVIAGMKIQPSEFAKIGLLLALARYFSEKNVSLYNLTSFIIPGLLIGVPFLLVLKQPDLGTAGVFCAMALPMFFWGGLMLLDLFFLLSPLLSLGLSAIPLILSFGAEKGWGFGEAVPWGVFFLALCTVLYFTRPPIIIMVGVIIANLFTATITTVVWSSFLKDYQKMRITSFINPQADPFGAGYQVIQSKVAVGSGHLFGKGFLMGTQTKLSYLPEQHTDFIKNRFFNLLIIGSATIITFHVFINIAMTIGMMPVTGIPLPFLSYGGSFTLTVAILIGLILNTKISSQEF